MIPVAIRVLGESDELAIGMGGNYARAFYKDPTATIDDLRAAVSMLRRIHLTARRVLGDAQPTAVGIKRSLRYARKALRARENTLETTLSPETLSGRAISLMNEL